MVNMSLEIDHGLEADQTDSDGYNVTPGTSYASSIATYIKEGIEENGRRYAAYGKGMYGMPIDEQEQARNDIQHAKFTTLLGGRFHLAPLDDPKRILDLGTGTGVWAVDMADKYEDAQVTGVDIAAIQSTWVPPNCNFEIVDIEDEWLLDSEFDFINGRELMLSIRDWDALCKRAFDHIKPGGYFELQGTVPWIESDDNTIPTNSDLFEISMIFFKMAEAMGTSGLVPKQWKALLEKAGFVNVQQNILKIPQGPWAKDRSLKKVGAFENHSLIVGLDAYMRRGYTQILQGDPKYLDKLIEGTIRELRDPKIHTYVT